VSARATETTAASVRARAAETQSFLGMEKPPRMYWRMPGPLGKTRRGFKDS